MLNIHNRRKVGLGLLLLLLLGFVTAQETENHVTGVLPALENVTVDDKFDDWDLSGGTFACGDVKRYRDNYSIWLHLLYDADNLYILPRWKDPTPLNNPQPSRGGYGFKRDGLQLRIAFNYPEPNERTFHLTASKNTNAVLIAGLANGLVFNGGTIPTITANGGQHALALVKDDPPACTQEIALPWKMSAPDGWILKMGESRVSSRVLRSFLRTEL